MRETFQLFRITKDYFYTPIIIFINVFVWVLMVVMGVNAFEPSVESLINWGGNLSSLTLNGQPWRLLTSTFLHGGILHLALNMFALLQVGAILEIHFGKHRYALAYLACGIFGSLASAAFSSNIVSVGASGAIFGLDGLLVSLLVTKSLKITQEESKALLISTLTFIGYNVMFGLSKSGIDNAAHIGGLASGFIIGFIYYPFLGKQAMSTVVSIVLTAITVIAIWAAPHMISNSYAQYDSAIKIFTDREASALWMYEAEFPKPGTTEATHFNERLKTEGIDLWKENLALLGTLNGMPSALEKRIDLLKKYCELRIESCEIMQVLAEEGGEEQVNRILDVNKQIEAVIKSLEELNK
ncbi:MAG: rhomboid family intramembrane serine protease [Bacteroidota bacterium]